MVFIVPFFLGDLTDAKSEDNMGSRQFVREWEYYRSVLSEGKITEKTIWLDIRGNHGLCLSLFRCTFLHTGKHCDKKIVFCCVKYNII